MASDPAVEKVAGLGSSIFMYENTIVAGAEDR
jgi:hypothetical protein